MSSMTLGWNIQCFTVKFVVKCGMFVNNIFRSKKLSYVLILLSFLARESFEFHKIFSDSIEMTVWSLTLILFFFKYLWTLWKISSYPPELLNNNTTMRNPLALKIWGATFFKVFSEDHKSCQDLFNKEARCHIWPWFYW